MIQPEQDGTDPGECEVDNRLASDRRLQLVAQRRVVR